MFTGLIEEVGALRKTEFIGVSGIVSVACQRVLAGTRIGDSIAVNGVCLTVVGMGAGYFDADVMAETIRRTNLGALNPGDPVNLERAMMADGRFGGHIVAGHVDGTGRIVSLRREENAVWVTIETPPRILRYIIEKGSIAIDGISLTVASLSETTFSVSIIPHTGEETTLLKKKAGEIVNLENDLVGKYVERLLTGGSDDAAKTRSGVTMEMLVEEGF